LIGEVLDNQANIRLFRQRLEGPTDRFWNRTRNSELNALSVDAECWGTVPLNKYFKVSFTVPRSDVPATSESPASCTSEKLL
jgi:hypothetical protein